MSRMTCQTNVRQTGGPQARSLEADVVPEFEQYQHQFEHVALARDAAGVLEVRLHTGGGPLVWGDGPHTELSYCFSTIAADPGNRVVILTGTGGKFCADLDA